MQRTHPFVLAAFAAATLCAACRNEDAPDAYGNFQATEITVSAQTSGLLRSFEVDEGDDLAAGQVVGLVDTAQLAAQRDNLLAQRSGSLADQRAVRVQARATLAQNKEATAGAGVIEAQLATARTELARTQRLFDRQAATPRDLSERQGSVATLAAQLEEARARSGTIDAQAGVPTAQANAVDDQVKAIDAQIRNLNAQLGDATVRNSQAGTVLSVIAEPGEFVQAGSQLYIVADLSTLKLRAYASGGQLPQLRLGMPVDVLVDNGEGGLRTLAGKVTWISAKAQFTPTPVQTRDERAELVYAFDVDVANPDGLLKVGMPGEVGFRQNQTASR